MIKFTIKVSPKSSKDEVVSEERDLFGNMTLKIKTTKPPEDGEANKSVIGILSAYFKVPQRKIRIISGSSSRTKIVELDD